MYRKSFILMSILIALTIASGCAKKNVPVEEVAPPEPVAKSEPVQKEEPAPVKVEEEDPLAEVFKLDSNALKVVFFDYDSYTLSTEAMDYLKGNAEMLQSDPAFNVIIEGHCDQRGSDEYNMSLGERRARAVMTYLASLGIEKDRLSVISYGEERPAIEGSDEQAWAKNRRVEFNKAM